MQKVLSYLTYLSEDKIAVFFLSYMFIVLVLNIIKSFLIWRYSKKEKRHHSCIHLKREGGEQVCSSSNFKKRFKKSNNSCKGCFGKVVKQNTEDIERSVKYSGRIYYLIITLADWGRVILPYASILFTLLSKISSNQLKT